MYETHILRLQELTDDQQRLIRECEEVGSRIIHIDAPAGTGKSFLGLHLVLDFLKRAGRRDSNISNMMNSGGGGGGGGGGGSSGGKRKAKGGSNAEEPAADGGWRSSINSKKKRR